MKASKNCIDLIKQFEGLRLSPYLDGAGIPTIGYGSTRYEDSACVDIDDPAISEQEADSLLLNDLNQSANYLQNIIKVNLTQKQTDAILSLVYNIGIGNFKNSTLRKYLNKNDLQSAGNQFLVWNERRDKKTGKLVIDNGLVKRRNTERDLFLS